MNKIMTTANYLKNGHLFRDSFLPAGYFKLVDNLLNESLGQPGKASFRPAADILELADRFEVRLALPGLRKEDIKVELKENRLSISGASTEETPAEGAAQPKYHLRETLRGEFSRSFRLPENANKEGISAEFRDGILVVGIEKKAAKEGVQTIEIR